MLFFFFFFNDTATTEIYTVRTLFPYTTLFRSGPDARRARQHVPHARLALRRDPRRARARRPRSEEHTSELQSLRTISYAVFCLKKKKKKTKQQNNNQKKKQKKK